MSDRRRTFGPVVLAGLLGGALAAVAGAKPWVVDSAAQAHEPILGVSPADPVAAAGEMPLALALGLVVLAGWGVILVTRGRLRRAVALVGALAALGYAATVVTGLVTLPDRVAEAARASAAGGTPDIGIALWGWGAVLAALVSVAATALAVAWTPAWPEMGSRYDAPGADRDDQAEQPPTERTHLDLWKSMDEGHDPTA